MEQGARIEHWICRRGAPRFRLGIPARLITLERHLTVVLEDISEGGARLALPAPHAFTVCVVKWLDFHAFAEVRWVREHAVGLEFASPLPPGTIERTLLAAPDLVTRVKRNAPGLHSR